jgi:hypothetical protein
MQKFERMTLTWAKSILEHYELKLGYGQWVPTIERPDECCPLGLYIINKEGHSGVFDGFVHQQWLHLCFSPRSMTAEIAKYVDIPYDYAIGLSNGYESTNLTSVLMKYECAGDEEKNLYEMGWQDGLTLSQLIPS